MLRLRLISFVVAIIIFGGLLALMASQKIGLIKDLFQDKDAVKVVVE